VYVTCCTIAENIINKRIGRRCVHMCICMHVYMYTYVCVFFVCVCKDTYTYTNECIHIHMYIYIFDTGVNSCLCGYILVCVHLKTKFYVNVYICMSVHMCVFLYK